MGTAEDTLARRQLLQAGVALLATSSGCEKAPVGVLIPPSGDGGSLAEDTGARRPDARVPLDAAIDGRARRAGDAAPPSAAPDATLAAESGTCLQTHYTRPISIAGAGIVARGTSTAFFDDRYLDPVCSGSRILVIHPTTQEAYVAMSGVCTHLCCDFTGGEGGPSYVATYGLADGGVVHDVVHCTCHGALFSALDGSVVSGPGGNPLATGLEILPACEGGGFVFVTIPARSS